MIAQLVLFDYVGERPDLVEGPYTAHLFTGMRRPFVIRVPFGRIVRDGMCGAVIADAEVSEWGLRSLRRFPDLRDGTRFHTLPDVPLPKKRTVPCPYCGADVWWRAPIGIPYGVLLWCEGEKHHPVRVEFSSHGVSVSPVE